MVHIKVSKVTKSLEIPYVNLSQNQRIKYEKKRAYLYGFLPFRRHVLCLTTGP